ncbi:hypothetical protein [Pseudomonas fluorescens]|uniref:hypothetical protein n=1 Tax=Pseudomonas fluorescens TaxID=294 RepID=UPI0020355328|nr:hypothetical protein [Pseudomonas fluorescens]
MRKIVIKGAVDVVFFRSPSAHLVVGGENQEAIRNIKTRFEGNKLVIEQEDVSISGAGGRIHLSATGNIFAGGRFNVAGCQSGITA